MSNRSRSLHRGDWERDRSERSGEVHHAQDTPLRNNNQSNESPHFQRQSQNVARDLTGQLSRGETDNFQNSRPQANILTSPSHLPQSPPFSPTATNTYPPRRHGLPGMDLSPSHEPCPDAYTDQLRRASGGEGSGGKGSKPVPLPRHNVPGAMAVVKPTVMHQGQLTFMEI